MVTSSEGSDTRRGMARNSHTGAASHRGPRLNSGPLKPFRGNLTAPPAGGKPLLRRHGDAPHPHRWLCRPLHPDPGRHTTIRARLGARDQARRLSADRAPGRPLRFPRSRLERTSRYPAIANAAGGRRAQSFTLDGKVWSAVRSEDGVAIFDALPVHLEILSASRNQTFTCCHRLPAYLNSSSSGFSRPK
jgi:hypothetical protein